MAGERAVVERHLADHLESREIFERLVLAKTELRVREVLIDVEAMQHRVAGKLRHENLAEGSSSPRQHPVEDVREHALRGILSLGKASLLNETNRWSRQAALGVLVMLVIAVGVVTSQIPRAPAAQQSYHARAGQRVTVALADGSRILLAPLTSVTVTSAAIRVSGEAYFDIASGAARAIVVHTPNAVVRVLGTQFSVRHYAGDVESRIVVVTGKVGVQSWTGASQRRQPVVVGAQSVARITDSTVSVSRGIAPAEYLAWTRDRLIFDQTPLHDVVTELNRVYDVDIRVADTLLAKQPLMMDVSIAHKPVADILTLIGRATGSHYRRDGRVFMLIPGRTVVPSEHSAPLHRDLYLKEKSYGK